MTDLKGLRDIVRRKGQVRVEDFCSLIDAVQELQKQAKPIASEAQAERLDSRYKGNAPRD